MMFVPQLTAREIFQFWYREERIYNTTPENIELASAHGELRKLERLRNSYLSGFERERHMKVRCIAQRLAEDTLFSDWLPF
ncbi:hypothetical protein QSX70_000576 [Vibrio metoecus]